MTNIGAWLDSHLDLPRLDRELLLLHHLHADRALLIAHPEKCLSSDKVKVLNTDAARLRNGEPLAYITGEKAFWSFNLKVTPAVLIPRPETETLIELTLARLKTNDRVLDLGTGSGAIAIAIAQASTANGSGGSGLDSGVDVAAVDIVAVDSSARALEIARHNAAALSAPVSFLLSDWYQQVEGDFNLIVANPPYIASNDEHLPALRYEPQQALVGGIDGMFDLLKIIEDAPSYLRPGGWLLVEHGYDQGARVAAAFARRGFSSIETQADLAGLDRVTSGRVAGDE